ncbi:hypothetical protein EXE44_04980 [Halorubrum sp. SS7]|uniref:hypothetical protein n=2 Tax=unclassified Halorubrum TaxID=2642239 RepID=UPI0010F4C9B9|nr:hypothetical protein [Halorubrum sp. SS7]TKX58901.1 hypothetical protein EXE44_04980 [Halorubrum sp. SS7]
MPATISITNPPSTDGATQTRTVTVSLTAPSQASAYDATVELRIDATQNGSYRELDAVTTSYQRGESVTLPFQQFIGAQPPYGLRAKATFTPPNGDAVVVRDTIVVGGGSDVPTPDELSAEDFDVDPQTAAVRGGDATDVTPRIGDVEPIILDAEYQLPWDRDNNQTACGQTIQNQNGDFNWRIVLSGVVSLSQLDAIRAMRGDASGVETRTAMFGIREVNFDQLNVTRSENPSVINMGGEVEPLYEIQLQTKELNDQTDNGLFGGN